MSAQALTKGSGSKRIEFLDFIRGIAALSVAAGHTVEKYYPSAKDWLIHQFSFGTFGVIAFFILSGFVIPFTVERYGSLKFFWINRFFRLYPLYWLSLAIATAVLLSALHPDISPYEQGLPKTFFFNLTMVQEFLHRDSAMGLYWTLGYELVFYAIISILFCFGLNKKSAWLLGVSAALIAYSGLFVAYRNGGSGFPYRTFWMSCFFFGTVTYRFWNKELGKRAFLLVTGAFLLAASTAAWLNFVYFPVLIPGDVLSPKASMAAWFAAFAFFLVVTFGPKFKVHDVFLWLGRISYSVYVMHGILVMIRLSFDPIVNVGITIAATLAAASLSQKFVEEPFQGLGKAIIKKMNTSKVTG